MRTVTFSNPEVRRRLAKDFRCVWTDLAGDEAAGASFAHDPEDAAPPCLEGNGAANVQVLLLDAQGRLLTLATGYLGPDALLRLLEESRSLRRRIAKLPDEEAADLLTRWHRERRAQVKRVAFDEEPLAFLSMQRKLSDRRFAAKRPLLPWKEIRTVDLVGRGRSFFGSSRGGIPEGRIGDAGSTPRAGESAQEALERLLGGTREKSERGGTTPTPRPRRPRVVDV